jgi:hypothetical protein
MDLRSYPWFEFRRRSLSRELKFTTAKEKNEGFQLRFARIRSGDRGNLSVSSAEEKLDKIPFDTQRSPSSSLHTEVVAMPRRQPLP